MSEEQKHQDAGQEEALLDTEAAAALLGISPRTLQGWVRQKRIPVVKMGEGKGSLTRFRPASLRKWIAAQEVQPEEGKREEGQSE